MVRKASARIGRGRGGLTLLDFLSVRYRYLSPEGWLAQIEAGRVTVNGSQVEAKWRLGDDDLVEFLPEPFAEPEVEFRFSVLYRDADFLVVNKPPLLPCHPGGRFFAHSLWYLLKADYPGCHVATRLDRETSGLVLLCLSRRSMGHLQRLQDQGGIRKSYLALVHGHFPQRLEAPGHLCLDSQSAVRKRRRFIPETGTPAPDFTGESCSTSFELVRECGGDGGAGGDGGDPCQVSLVRALPRTGRTHQIRATLSSLGFPLVGDKLYGLDEGMFLRFADGGLTEEDRRRLVLPHQALHCESLVFSGLEGGEIEVAAPLPLDFAALTASPL